MAFCIHCGAKLREGVNFCEKCGVEIYHDDAITEKDFDEDEDGEPDVEVFDDEDEKGPSTDCYATFDGRTVSIYRENGCIHRRINMRSEVLSAVVSGDRVSITCEGGWFYIYTVDGVLIRQMRH